MAKLKPAVHEGDRATGNKNANIILVEFGDYQCPHCGHAYPLLKRLRREMADQLYFVFRNFPLREIHPYAFTAAIAAEAAGKQGKFWEMHDLIFENQEMLNTDYLFSLAGMIGLDPAQFAKDLTSKKIMNKIETDFESGLRSGVNGTPSFFLNDYLIVSYNETYESLLDAIQMEFKMNQQ